MSRFNEFSENVHRDGKALPRAVITIPRAVITIPDAIATGVESERTAQGKQYLRSTRRLSGAFLIAVRRNLLFALAVAISLFSIVIAATWMMTPVYRAEARIEVEAPGGDIAMLYPAESQQLSSNDPEYLDTQAQIISSPALAIQVIRKLNLDSYPKDMRPQGKSEANGLAVKENRTAEWSALKAFEEKLSVKRIRNSRLLSISVEHHNPKEAARLVNTLVETYLETTYKTRYNSTMQASEWLTRQLDGLKKRVNDTNDALARFQSEHGIQAIDDNQNPIKDTLVDLNKMLAQIEAERIQLGIAVQMANSGTAASLPEIRGNTLIQDLTRRLLEARANRLQAMGIYGDRHPNIDKLRRLEKEIQSQIEAEGKKIINELNARFEACSAREKATRQRLQGMNRVVANMNKDLLQYNFLKKEAQTSQDLYNTLYARLKEAGISAGLKSSNIRLIDSARVDPRHIKPRWTLNVAMGLLLALVGGIGTAFLKENMTSTVQCPADIESSTGLPALGILPWLNQRRLLHKAPSRILNAAATVNAGTGKFLLDMPSSPEAEAVRNFHSLIAFSRAHKEHKVLLIASPAPHEGKTLVATNLSVALAQHGSVCLIDCDMRRPAIAQAFGLRPEKGLSNALRGDEAPENILLKGIRVPKLSVLPAGPVAVNSAELIESKAMKELLSDLRNKFDRIILDSPPIIPFADARVLSTLVDGVVLVARYGHTRLKTMILSTEILLDFEAPVIGAVLNGMDRSSPDYVPYLSSL